MNSNPLHEIEKKNVNKIQKTITGIQNWNQNVKNDNCGLSKAETVIGKI